MTSFGKCLVVAAGGFCIKTQNVIDFLIFISQFWEDVAIITKEESGKGCALDSKCNQVCLAKNSPIFTGGKKDKRGHLDAKMIHLFKVALINHMKFTKDHMTTWQILITGLCSTPTELDNFFQLKVSYFRICNFTVLVHCHCFNEHCFGKMSVWTTA